MSYNYDPELVALLEFLPDAALTISDPENARASFGELMGQFNAELDRSGVDIVDRNISGPSEAPRCGDTYLLSRGSEP